MFKTKFWLPAGLKLGVIAVFLLVGCDAGDEVQNAGPDAKSPKSTSGKNENPAAANGAAGLKQDDKVELEAKVASKSGRKPDAASKAEVKPEPEPSVEPDLNDARFHAAIKKVADDYLAYGLVNTRINELAEPKVAAEDCRPPLLDVEPEPRLSSADEEQAHTQKLYFLFAKDIVHYTNRDGSNSPVGQVLVKEAWTSKPGNPNARNLRTHASAVRISPRVKVGDQTLEIGQRTDLFVMIKQAEKTSGTDEGWVYGVIDADSREIKSAGAVATCIACHDGQKDRLFRDGIPDWDARVQALISEDNSTADAGDEENEAPNAAKKPNAAK